MTYPSVPVPETDQRRGAPRAPTTSAPCAECRYPLWHVPGQGWIHQTTRSVWCDPTHTHQATPASR